MANRERTGWRDFAYSKWHRELDDRLSFLDIDWVERCDSCKRPLAVCELAVDNGRNDDHAYFTTQRIARALDQADRQGTVRGFLVLYSKDPSNGITGFRIKQVHPTMSEFVAMSPQSWAERLYRMRWCHPVSRTVEKNCDHLNGWAKDAAGFYCVRCSVRWEAA